MKTTENTEGLKENLEKYQTLVNNLSVGVYRNTPGPKGHFLEANPAMVAMFEADSKDEFIKHNVSDFYQNPAKRKLFVEKLTKYGFVKNEELDLVTLKGRKMTASVSAVMKKDKDGAIYFDGIIEDVTDRKRTEEALSNARDQLEIRVKERTKELDLRVAELEDARNALTNVLEDLNVQNIKAEALANDLSKFKLALDNVSDHVTITDTEGMAVYVNKAVERITGYTPEEAIGKKAGVLWKTPMPREYYRQLWHTIKEQKKTFEGEIQNRRKDGQIYTAAINISPVLAADGNILFFVGLERDITREKEIDRAKTEFVSLASHQLRTPLTGIGWLIELMLKKEKLTDKGKEYLNDILYSVHRSNALVKLLLDTSRIESGSVGVRSESLELVEFIEKHLVEYRLLCEKKNLTLTFTHGEDQLNVTTDLNLLEYILQNLVSNAIDYTPAQGRIEVLLEKKKNSVLMQVADTGIGIPKTEQGRLFEKFMRASNAVTTKTDGTGLGLYIAREAAKLLGGKIWMESPTFFDTVAGKKQPKGSTFFVEFPLVSASRAGGSGLASAKGFTK